MIQNKPYYIKGRGITLEEQLSHIFTAYEQNRVTVRLVFFGNPVNNKDYLSHLKLITQFVYHYFKDQPPVFSYVAQPSLEESLVMEVVELIPESGMQVFYKRWKDIPYIIAESSKIKRLFLGGVKADTYEINIRQQSDEIFSKLEEIISFEEMPISSIIRQWNYIEQIVRVTNGHQNYQDFNESRARFYDKASWVNGYPAATGVGSCCAGVMIDLDAFHPVSSGVEVLALNNSWQVPAHGYSPCVLIGTSDVRTGLKTTPKFERGKLVYWENKGLVYVSGTAAIRGEESLKNVGIVEQTRITLENIEHLISKEILSEAGVENASGAQLHSMRVYLKDEALFEPAKQIINEKYEALPSVYLKGDVCREELLVEIEGFAYMDLEGSKPDNTRLL